jgi:hypothetical protein
MRIDSGQLRHALHNKANWVFTSTYQLVASRTLILPLWCAASPEAALLLCIPKTVCSGLVKPEWPNVDVVGELCVCFPSSTNRIPQRDTNKVQITNEHFLTSFVVSHNQDNSRLRLSVTCIGLGSAAVSI